MEYKTNKIAIILWLYHNDLTDEFLQLLIPIKKYIKIYLQLCSENNNTKTIDKFHNSELDHTIFYHKNSGVDVLPFLIDLPKITEKYFIKIHSKKSCLGRRGYINWRAMLLHSLIGNREIFLCNFLRMQNDSSIGMIGCENLVMDSIGKNIDQFNSLNRILDINIDLNKIKYIGGNMFLSKTELFHNILCDNKNYSKIIDILNIEDNKPAQIKDGTYAHALERLFGSIIIKSKLDIKEECKQYTLILNNDAPNSQNFHMVILYNNDCYLAEDINVYGKVLQTYPMNIEWYHMRDRSLQKYEILDKQHIKKI